MEYISSSVQLELIARRNIRSIWITNQPSVCIYYNHKHTDKGSFMIFLRFLTTFLKIFEDHPKIVRGPHEIFENFGRFLKITEDCRRPRGKSKDDPIIHQQTVFSSKIIVFIYIIKSSIQLCFFMGPYFTFWWPWSSISSSFEVDETNYIIRATRVHAFVPGQFHSETRTQHSRVVLRAPKLNNTTLLKMTETEKHSLLSDASLSLGNEEVLQLTRLYPQKWELIGRSVGTRETIITYSMKRRH